MVTTTEVMTNRDQAENTSKVTDPFPLESRVVWAERRTGPISRHLGTAPLPVVRPLVDEFDDGVGGCGWCGFGGEGGGAGEEPPGQEHRERPQDQRRQEKEADHGLVPPHSVFVRQRGLRASVAAF